MFIRDNIWVRSKDTWPLVPTPTPDADCWMAFASLPSSECVQGSLSTGRRWVLTGGNLIFLLQRHERVILYSLMYLIAYESYLSWLKYKAISIRYEIKIDNIHEMMLVK